MFHPYRKTLLSGTVALALGLFATGAIAAGFQPAQPAGKLGAIVVDPYGNAPLTALIELDSHTISDVKVTVHGKGEKGVPVSYSVGKQSLATYDGIPVFGLYQKHANKVTVEYTENGKAMKEDYVIQTSAIVNRYMDNRSISDLQKTKVIKVAPGFEDRLYLVNTHTFTPQGAEFHWHGEKDKNAGLLDAGPAGGALPFDIAPFTFVVDTEGEYRWWLDQDTFYDGHDMNINKRGYLMGIRETPRGTFTAVQGQHWYEFDMMGQVLADHKLPRGFLDATHESIETVNGTVLLRVGKRNYRKEDGLHVHTIRDQIIEVDKSGRVIDVWDLTKILDPLRDSLLGALDAGAVCVNVDLEHAGQQAKLEPDTPFGDALGVGAGRNWAHVNSIAYDAKDDAIILSSRHQGIVKIGRDKQVKWILAPAKGWNKQLASKLLKPVDSKGNPLTCNENGKCENTDFDFSYTQHTAWLTDKGTLTVFDNGDGRWLEQPALPSMKYSRFVEYKIDEKNGTVQQLWQYGKERGYDFYSPITSVIEYQKDRDTIFGFSGSINLFEVGQPTIGKINEIDYKTKDVKVEIDVLSDKPNQTHYRALLVHPQQMFK
ncbi:aryl-sulfate sulfotransferase [Citrobacter rodentium]|uniref:Arylsulfate sulfotransferase AssT n=2 Tax=Citrobacter rodentium TaxID=67825 RepID=D2TRN7_CITRI|nr:aryl-sulfate sulfotransferase [Citrobacter rodentium]KIQ49852.1 arylsulfate sulfotransferase [Citrobacter rodentium]QBY29941.1 aryl-sulfate sulfotransferase [Citrobacter rodentium]UHO32671.1 aryl-sulfate sulfotransferase [Citrobacter rodentium NBRC 105723 = DSM 16636]CBG90297.1 arylsulfate sulfotransferase [Citrobacter rodentium ICC168]HAT8014285.1 aryl-sulfate sulfotransferase [Citrobacter rodentium NBRC 105723 = DSM 16636]